MIVGGCRSVFSHLLTTKVWENRPWIRTCVCGELQVAATASKGVILGWVTFLVSRLLESGKKAPTWEHSWFLLRAGDTSSSPLTSWPGVAAVGPLSSPRWLWRRQTDWIPCATGACCYSPEVLCIMYAVQGSWSQSVDWHCDDGARDMRSTPYHSNLEK